MRYMEQMMYGNSCVVMLFGILLRPSEYRPVHTAVVICPENKNG
jgi:hypothetical protein